MAKPYSKEEIESKFNLIIEKIEYGLSLRKSLKDEGVSSRTFFEWIKDNDIRQKQYAHACEERSEKIFEEMIDIADDGTNDYMTIEKGDMLYNVEDKEVVNRSRLRIDTRKWMLSKMMPKKYGDKLDVTTNGKDIPTQPMIVEIVRPNEDDE